MLTKDDTNKAKERRAPALPTQSIGERSFCLKDVLYVSDVVSLQLGQTGLLFFSPSYRCIDQQTTPTLLIFSLSRGKNDYEICDKSNNKDCDS